MQTEFDSIRVNLVSARNSFLTLYTSRKSESELTAALIDALKNVGTALDNLAALSVDMGGAVDNWAPLFNAGALVTFGEDSDKARALAIIDGVAFALGKDRSAAVRAIATRFSEYLACLPLDNVDAFKSSLGVKLVKVSRSEISKAAKEVKAAEKARKAAEKAAEKARKAAEKAAAPKKRRTSVKAEYEAILAQLQKEVGLTAVKDAKTGQYTFVKAVA